jgi:hypothetical protein
MARGDWVRATAATAEEVCGRFAMGEPSRALLRPGQAPGPFLDALIEAQEFPDAVRFLAHALPKREAVWWAVLCAREAAGDDPPAPVAAALRAAEAWVVDPSEENRRASWSAAEAAGLEAPAGCAAASAFWSGGSLAPPDVPAVPPGEHLTAHGVAGAVMLAAVSRKPEKAPDTLRASLRVGIEIATGARAQPEGAPRPAVATAAPAPATDPQARTKQPSRPPLNWD